MSKLKRNATVTEIQFVIAPLSTKVNKQESSVRLPSLEESTLKLALKDFLFAELFFFFFFFGLTPVSADGEEENFLFCKGILISFQPTRCIHGNRMGK